jgi:hypothetical protein
MKIGVFRILLSLGLLLGTANVLHAAVAAPDFTLRKFTGGTYQLAESRGKEVVVLLAWASW